MKLLDRYLLSIKSYLPEAHRDDIIKELTQNLRERIEDQQSGLRRDLTEDELVVILKQYGHPITVAGRYLPRQHLIGPAVFPVYWVTLKMSLWITAIVYVVVASTMPFVAGLVKTSGKAVPEVLLATNIGAAIWGGIWLLVGIFGIVTLLFAVVDLGYDRFRLLERWDPRTLHPAASGELKPRTEAIFMVAGCGAYVLCSILIPDFPLVVGRAGYFVHPLPAWEPFRVTLQILFALGTVEGILYLARPRLMRFMPAMQALRSLAGAVILFLLFRSGDLITISSTANLTAEDAHKVVTIVNESVHYGLLLGFAMTLLNGGHKILKHIVRRVPVAVLLALVCVSLPAQQVSTEEIRKILVERIDVQHRGVGIVVGVVSPEGRRVVAYGKVARGSSADVDGDTLFEIGSVTKVFTSLLLTDAVKRGEVGLNDPLGKYLPARIKTPDWKGKPVTLVDLATHTAGLPFFPSNFPHSEDRAEYGKYTVSQVYEFLSTYELPREPGTRWEYSNTAGGLLGLALSRRAGMDYMDLVKARITDPLGMESTSIELTPKAQARLAEGYDADLKPQPKWDLPALPGAGSLRSSANDLVALLAAFTGNVNSPLQPAMDAMTDVVRPNQLYMIDQGLGWFIIGKGPERLLIHGGGTFGYASSIAYSPKDHTGVAVLSNMAGSVDDIARHILRRSMPLDKPQPRVERHEISVAPKLLDQYAGMYRPSPDWVYTVRRDGNMLRIQLPAAPSMRLFAETEKDFFLKEDNIQVTFKTGDDGAVTGLVLHLWGFNVPAARVSVE